MRPSLDPALIASRHAAIRVLMKSENTETCKEAQRLLRGVSDLDRCVADSATLLAFTSHHTARVLARILQARSAPITWIRLATTLQRAVDIAGVGK